MAFFLSAEARLGLRVLGGGDREILGLLRLLWFLGVGDLVLRLL